jgi:hypothetical protein
VSRFYFLLLVYFLAASKVTQIELGSKHHRALNTLKLDLEDAVASRAVVVHQRGAGGPIRLSSLHQVQRFVLTFYFKFSESFYVDAEQFVFSHLELAMDLF